VKFGEQRRNGGAAARGALVVVAIALVGAATWWLLRESTEDAARDAVRRGGEDADAAKLDAAGAAGPTKEPLEATVERKFAPGPDSGEGADSTSADTPRPFHVHVFDEADGCAVANASVLVSFLRADALANTTTRWGPVPALVLHGGAPPITDTARTTVKSDAAGDAKFDVPPSEALFVDVLATGYTPVWFSASAGRGTKERPLEVGLARSASLRGIVLGPDRQPVAGLRLLCQFDRRGLERPRPPFASMFGAVRGECSVVPDASGRFSIPGLPADVELHLNAGSDEEEMRRWRHDLWLDPGEERELTWILPRGASVSGRVVGADGTPVAGAMVLVVDFVHGIVAAATCEDSGSFRVPAAPSGEIALQVDPRDAHRAVEVVPLTLADGEERSGVEIRIPDAAPLVVRALDPEGARVDPAEVHVDPLAFRFVRRDVVHDSAPEADTASIVPGVPFGDVTVRVVAPLASPWPAVETKFHHDGKHECEVRFAVGGRLGGTLVDALDPKQPVAASATLLRRGAAPCFWSAQTMQSMAAPGTFEFTNVAAGTYDVLAQAGDGRVGVAAGVVFGAGEQRGDVVVALARGATLELVVPPSVAPPRTNSEEGSSIRFEARAAGAFVGAAFAAPLGRTSLTVPPGRLTITAIAAGEVVGTREVEARVGAVVRVRF